MRWTRAFSHPALPYGTRRTEAAAEGKDWCGGGFPAHEKCPAPSRRAGHFRVRLSGRYNALYLAAPGGQQGVRPGIPRDPVCGFGCAGNGPCLARILRPFAAVFAAGHRGRGENPIPAAKTHLRGTWDGRRGIPKTKTAPAIFRRRCRTRRKRFLTGVGTVCRSHHAHSFPENPL